jgi:Putative restriction endonuclease
MSGVRQPRALLTPEEYLRLEREAEFKSEYVNGPVYAMAGAKVNHNRIAANVLGILWSQLRGRPCEALGSDMKVRIDKANAFRYPDVSGLCEPMLFHDDVQDAYRNPSVKSRSSHRPQNCLIAAMNSRFTACSIPLSSTCSSVRTGSRWKSLHAIRMAALGKPAATVSLNCRTPKNRHATRAKDQNKRHNNTIALFSACNT